MSQVLPNLDIVILSILLIFGRTRMPWLLCNNIIIPSVAHNIYIQIPLKYYPESTVQARGLSITTRYIYHVLALFLLGEKQYNSHCFHNMVKKLMTLTYCPNSMAINITIKSLSSVNIDTLKAAACNTLLDNIHKQLTPQQATFIAYIAAFNTVHHICHNKSYYDNRGTYSYLAPTYNISRSYLERLADLMNMDKSIQGVSYNTIRGCILYYPLLRNIMTNNQVAAYRARNIHVNLATYIVISNYDNTLETQIKKYLSHCNILLDSSSDDLSMVRNYSNDVFIT